MFNSSSSWCQCIQMIICYQWNKDCPWNKIILIDDILVVYLIDNIIVYLCKLYIYKFKVANIINEVKRNIVLYLTWAAKYGSLYTGLRKTNGRTKWIELTKGPVHQ